jgi:hypothetical protein
MELGLNSDAILDVKLYMLEKYQRPVAESTTPTYLPTTHQGTTPTYAPISPVQGATPPYAPTSPVGLSSRNSTPYRPRTPEFYPELQNIGKTNKQGIIAPKAVVPTGEVKMEGGKRVTRGKKSKKRVTRKRKETMMQSYTRVFSRIWNEHAKRI